MKTRYIVIGFQDGDGWSDDKELIKLVEQAIDDNIEGIRVTDVTVSDDLTWDYLRGIKWKSRNK